MVGVVEGGSAGDRLEWAAFLLVAGPAVVLSLWLVSVVAQKAKPARDEDGVYGPVKWLFLFASGAKLDVLRECPSEESKYVGLGSAVLVTSTMAALSGTVALSYAVKEPWTRLWPFGLLYGVVIFLLDRFLVSQQLNPVRLTPSSVPGVWTPGDAETQYLLRSRGRSWRIDWGKPFRVLGVMISAIPRLALALVIGTLIAEPMLLRIFEPEVNARVAEIRNSELANERARIEAEYDELLTNLEEDFQSGSDSVNATRLAEARDEKAGVDGDVNNAYARVVEIQGEIDDLKVLLQDEIRGQTNCVGDQCTSGKPGDGPNAAQFREQIATKDDELSTAKARLNGLLPDQERLQAEEDELTRLVSEESQADTASQDQYNTARAALLAQKQDSLDNAKVNENNFIGLLVQIEALESLARGESFGDEGTTSVTSTTNGVEAAPVGEESAPEAPFVATEATVQRGMFGLTSIGFVIWLLRAWILLIDVMPILFKISLSLRSRRPYDALIAAREEEAMAVALARVDKAYSQLGEAFWQRMADRDLHRRHLIRRAQNRWSSWRSKSDEQAPSRPPPTLIDKRESAAESFSILDDLDAAVASDDQWEDFVEAAEQHAGAHASNGHVPPPSGMTPTTPPSASPDDSEAPRDR